MPADLQGAVATIQALAIKALADLTGLRYPEVAALTRSIGEPTRVMFLANFRYLFPEDVFEKAWYDRIKYIARVRFFWPATEPGEMGVFLLIRGTPPITDGFMASMQATYAATIVRYWQSGKFGPMKLEQVDGDTIVLGGKALVSATFDPTHPNKKTKLVYPFGNVRENNVSRLIL